MKSEVEDEPSLAQIAAQMTSMTSKMSSDMTLLPQYVDTKASQDEKHQPDTGKSESYMMSFV